MKYEDWIELGAEELRRRGPAPFTVENLCARANRTKGSFYHHFDGIHSFTLAVVGHWTELETEVIARGTELLARASFGGDGPMERLQAMWRLTATTDHRLELGVRALALTDPQIAKLVAATDERREAIMTGLLADAYGLDEARAGDFARIFHALHLSAQMRAADDIAGFSRGAVRTLVGLLEGETKEPKS
jgi:AcrR family transcriptional regulator